jgi:O-antigen/teichoic acid export membrane protein
LIPTLLHFGFPLIFSEFALLIISGASIYFLSYYFGLESVAIFSLGSKLASVLLMAIILPFQLAFQPFVFSNLTRTDIKEVISKILSYLFLAITLMFFIILFGSRILLPFIAPPEYSSAFLVILLLLPGIAFIGIYYIGETLLGAVKKTHLIGFMMSVYALLAMVLNHLLIPQLKWYGAVIATNSSYLLAGVTFLMLGKKHFSFYIEWRKIIVCAILFISFFGTFLILTRVQIETFLLAALMVALVSIWTLSKMQFFSSKELNVLKDFF